MNKTCEVNMDDFSRCKKSYGYGLNRFEPCVFFKLNADTKWKPDTITIDNITDEMPENVQNSIKNWHEMKMSAVWLSCEGVNEHDQSNLGSIYYMPLGFHTKYFPCQSEEFCTSPIVAVLFERLKSE